MKQILLILAVLLAFTFEAMAQKAWKGGDIKGVPAFATGGTSFTLADTATCDTTNAATTIRSAVFTNGGLSLKKVLVGYVILDSSKTLALAGSSGPVVSVDVQASLDGSTFVTVVDSAVSAKRWLAQQVRTGFFNLGSADLTTLKYPYWRLQLRTTGTVGTVSSWPRPGGQVPKIKWVIIPAVN